VRCCSRDASLIERSSRAASTTLACHRCLLPTCSVVARNVSVKTDRRDANLFRAIEKIDETATAFYPKSPMRVKKWGISVVGQSNWEFCDGGFRAFLVIQRMRKPMDTIAIPAATTSRGGAIGRDMWPTLNIDGPNVRPIPPAIVSSPISCHLVSIRAIISDQPCNAAALLSTRAASAVESRLH
jgi:hypothetical protein